MKQQLVWLLCVLIVVDSVEDDAFTRADLNNDGVLEKSEFISYSKSLAQAIRPFLITTEGGDAIEQEQEAHEKKRIDHSGFGAAFISGILTIWATEVGDKTFFIAAILSMRHDRSIIFAGAIGALIVMTVLSVALGGVVGYFLPKELTHYAGTLLFVVFGLRMLNDARKMEDSKPSEELAEVEEELELKKGEKADDAMESGGDNEQAAVESTKKLETLLRVLSQAFFMTFLAEWGDRSQIATITLSTTKNAFGVTFGAILGHSMCTGLAVVGGKMLATRISEKTVTIIGGVLFLMFGAHSLVTGP